MATNRGRGHGMAYVTAPDRATARRIARAVLESRLAACANLMAAESLYWWRGAIEEAQEVVVVFKTRRALLGRLIAAVRDVHPYDVPCAVGYGMVASLPAYARWIDESTASVTRRSRSRSTRRRRASGRRPRTSRT